MVFTFKQRLSFFFIAALFFLGIFYVGYSVNIDKSFSDELKKTFLEQIKDIDESGIFFNNVKIALVMFIPVVGVIIGAFSAFSTGLIFNSILNIANSNILSSNPLIVFLTPFGLLELFSYSLAISRGGMLLYEISKKKISKKTIYYLLIEIALVCIMLFIGALIEWSMIVNLPKIS